MRFFQSKNRKNYIMFSKLKVFSVKFNHNLFSGTIISIHFPINKKRAHGSVSSRFAGGYGSEFLAMKNIPKSAIEGFEYGESGLWKRICKKPYKN